MHNVDHYAGVDYVEQRIVETEGTLELCIGVVAFGSSRKHNYQSHKTVKDEDYERHGSCLHHHQEVSSCKALHSQ